LEMNHENRSGLPRVSKIWKTWMSQGQIYNYGILTFAPCPRYVLILKSTSSKTDSFLKY